MLTSTSIKPTTLNSDSGHTVAGFPIVEQSASVISNDWVNGEYRHLVVSCRPPATNGAPGQFFHLLCPSSSSETPYLRRPMSIYATDPERGTVEFLYKVTGAGTRGLAQLGADDHLSILGPLGIGFRLEQTWRSIVVVGRGVGLATLAPLASMARQHGIAVTAILSARSPELLMSVDAFEKQGAAVLTVTDVEGNSNMTNVEQLLRSLVNDNKADAFFTCGSHRLTVLLQKLGRAMGIPGQVALEQQMACGLGMCFCCVKAFRSKEKIEQRRVCLDGPVFDIAEALP